MKSLAYRVCKTLEGMMLLPEEETQFGSMVYRFCHIACGECSNPHSDWNEGRTK